MGNLKAKDADNTNKFLKATGDGSELNPFIVEHLDSSVLTKLEEIRNKIIISPATETTLNQVVTQLQLLLAELRIKADLSETQLISGPVTITNLPIDPPTAALQNTQILRLEAIRDYLADIKGYTDSLELLLASLNSYVDGLETLLGTANTTQSAISGFVDNLESYTDGIESKLDNLLIEMQEKANLSETQPISGNVGFISVNRTSAFINTTNAGTIAAGAQSVAIANIGSAVGTVKGTNLPVGASISWGANANDKLDAINYDATGTTFLITTVI
jgi:hypothetical protein